MVNTLGRQAVVLGGSVAGMLAAWALRDRFERVVVLERDALPSAAEPRKGTPQGQHTHGLLASGLMALEEFFPGIRDDLVRRGAVMGDGMLKTRWHLGGDWHVQFESGLYGICQSRPLLEQVIRERVATSPRIAIRDRMGIEGIVASESRDRILAVQAADRRNGGIETLRADLVVDAMGRGSRTLAWLEELGYPRPPEDRVEIDLTYVTRTFRRRPGQFEDNMAVIIPQSPPTSRFGVAAAIEGDRWSVTVGGMHFDVPAATPEGFVEFARGLPSPVFHEFLQTAEPLSDVLIYKYPASQRRRYERLNRFPSGLAVMGDALCSFNPIFGQGMSVAALEARALGECLEKGLTGLSRRFFREAASIIDVPWQMAATSDTQFAHVRGARPWGSRLINAYLRLLHQAAHENSAVTLAFHRVANLLDKPAELFHPRVVGPILRHWWSGAAGGPRGKSSCQPCSNWT